MISRAIAKVNGSSELHLDKVMNRYPQTTTIGIEVLLRNLAETKESMEPLLYDRGILQYQPYVLSPQMESWRSRSVKFVS